MKKKSWRRRRGGLAVLATFVLASAATQTSADTGAPVPPVQHRQRLSQWLREQPVQADQDLLGLRWQSSSEVAGQQARQAELVRVLNRTHSALAATLREMQATGRVSLPKTDARWLEANAGSDPILMPGDTVVLPRRSGVVTVLQSSGHFCQVGYRVDASIAGYLQACGQDVPAHAWLVQPDGRVLSYRVARWNEEAQRPPAPGAWIWAPAVEEGIAPETSHRIAAFLSTQGAAAEGYPWAFRRQLPSKAPRASSLRAQAPVSNDWGAVGLLQTPTARMAPAGTAGLTFSRVEPYSALKLKLQPVDWLELSFGYMGISDRRYGSEALSGDQSYKDKSADVKLRVWQESAMWPEVAIGLRDLLGTGAFAGEYVVANKRWGPLDFSVGLGFGYVGARGNVRNPLGLVSGRFDDRPPRSASSTNGGELNGRSFFRGRSAFFGGVQAQLPWERWLVKLEVEGNDYRHEFPDRPIKQDTPVNVGVVYRPASWAEVTVGVERGNTAMFALSVHSDLDALFMPKFLDPKPVPVSPYPPVRAPARLAVTAKDVETQSKVPVQAIHQRGDTWTVVLATPNIGYERPVLDRVAGVVHRDAPPEVKRFDLRVEQHGVPIIDVEVDRGQWARERTQWLPDSQRRPSMASRPVDEASTQSPPLFERKPDRLTYGLGLSYRQNLGGPDAFLLYQLAADVDGQFNFRRDTWLVGTYRLGLIDNYDKFKYTAPSSLPRVRTYLREYLVSSRSTIPNLQLTHLGRLAQNHFYMAYGGLLETMYAGVGAEYLYRPVNSRLALGVDLNRVRQREFEQKFSLRDYEVTTGHATAYWDTGFADILAKVSVGQYLAGDRGVTLDLSRVFKNGVTMGAYATKTNVSAEQFGEGSFDKGIYVKIPFDALLPTAGPSNALIIYSPLLRDGGAKLQRRYNLFDLTRSRDPRALELGPPQ